MADEIALTDAVVVNLIQDAAGRLTQPQRYSAINSARSEYEQVHPRSVSVAVAGDGGFDYPVATKLTAFAIGFSGILGIWYPYSVSVRNPKQLAAAEYELFPLVAGVALRFTGATPAVGESFLVVHTAPHTLNTSGTTIPATDREAIADLAASYCSLELASLCTQDVDNAIQADVMNRLSKADHYRSNSNRFREAYQRKTSESAARIAGLALSHPPAPTSGFTTVRPRSLFH